MSDKNESIALIGAGLTGCMTALLLNQLGYKVAVYEKRGELRIVVRIFDHL